MHVQGVGDQESLVRKSEEQLKELGRKQADIKKSMDEAHDARRCAEIAWRWN